MIPSHIQDKINAEVEIRYPDFKDTQQEIDFRDAAEYGYSLSQQATPTQEESEDELWQSVFLTIENNKHLTYVEILVSKLKQSFTIKRKV